MKILVTGSNGFIGQNMVNRLRETDHEVSEYDLSSFESIGLSPQVEGNDLVIHLGAESATTTSLHNALSNNLVSSIELFEDCIKHNVNFQFASSASVYGLESTFKEDAEVNPSNHYARSKYMFEEYMRTRNAQIRWQAFRYFNVYGPNEEHKGKQASPFTQFEKQAKENGVIKIFEGSEKFKRDFIHVNRIVDLHEKFFNISQSGVWNFGVGHTYSFHDIASEVANKYNADIEYIPMPVELKAHYQKYTCANITKLKATLNENSYN